MVFFCLKCGLLCNMLLYSLTYKHFSNTSYSTFWTAKMFLYLLNNAEFLKLNIYNTICTEMESV